MVSLFPALLGRSGRWPSWPAVLAATVVTVLAGSPAAGRASWPAVQAAGASGTWLSFTNGNRVNDLAVDPATGEVWAATHGGVLVWDPATRSHVKLTVADGLIDNQAWSVALDPTSGNRWLGTWEGLSRVTPDGTWTAITMEDGLVWRTVSAIVVHPATGEVWAATARGVTRLDRDGRRLDDVTTANGLPDDWVQAMAVDPRSGDLWFGTANGGAARRSTDGRWSTFAAGSGDGPIHNRVHDLAVHPGTGAVWFATGGGASRRNVDGTWVHYTQANSDLASDIVLAVALDPATGDVWLGTEKGAGRLAPDGRWLSLSIADGLPASRVDAIAIDPSNGHAWLGTPAGLARWAESGGLTRHVASDSMPHSEVYGVAVQPVTGERWFATLGGGVARLAADGSWVRYSAVDGGIASDMVRAVAAEPGSGATWFATEGGLSRRAADGTWQTFNTANSPGLVSDRLFALAFGTGGEMWVGSYGQGASRRGADGTWRPYTATDGLSANEITAIAVDPTTGNVWFGTWGGGATRLAADGRADHFRRGAGANAGLVDDRVLAVAVHPATGDVWFGTVAGVSRLARDGTWETFTLPGDPLWNQVHAIAIDPASGDIWFGHLGPGASRRTPDGRVDLLGTADGLTNGIVRGIALDPANGDVWFGTRAGASVLTARTAGGACETALVVEPGQEIVASLAGPTDADYYRVNVTQPFATLRAILPDPEDRFTIEIARNCGSSAGSGVGRHIGSIDQEQVNVAFRTGPYYIAVRPADPASAYPLSYHLQVSIGAAAPEATHTLILTHARQLAALWGLRADSDELATWWRGLQRLTQRAEVGAVLVGNVQTDTDGAVEQAYSDWLDRPSEPGRANAVADALGAWVGQVRQVLPALRYVVIAGDDRLIPYRRVTIVNDGRLLDGWQRESDYLPKSGIDPTSPVGMALALDQTLTDDVYGAGTLASWGDGQALFLPDLAVGRLVERPSDMTATIDAYVARRGALPLGRALTAGYAFMQDAVQQADATLAAAGLAEAQRSRLRSADLTAAALRGALLNARHDLAFLGVHASHQTFTLADQSVLRADGVVAAPADLSAAVVIGLACHGGLNVPGPGHGAALDFPEAWGRRGSTWVGSTGWAYGLEGFLAYQEVLMTDLVQGLVRDGRPIGEALVEAKRAYLRAHDLNAMHAKTLVGTTLYGLPMLRVDAIGMPAASPLAGARGLRPARPVDARPLAGGPSAETHRVELTFRFGADDLQRVPGSDGEYYTLSGRRPRAEGGEPVQPKDMYALGPNDRDGQSRDPRGVVLTGGRYRDEPDFRPLVQAAGVMAAAGTTVARPAFDLPGWYPGVPVSLRRADLAGAPSGAPGAGWSNLLLYVGQFHAGRATERLMEELRVEVYYSAAEDRDGPQVDGVTVAPRGAELALGLNAADPSGIARVVVAYPDGTGQWRAMDVAAGAGPAWHGTVPAAEALVIQVVDGAGNVTTVDERGQVNRPCAGRCAPVEPPGPRAGPSLLLPYAQRP